MSGGNSGNEIDIGETLRVDSATSRANIVAIKILFLYNGPEYGDLAEKAQVTADNIVYTLSVNNDADDATAVWSRLGATVTKWKPPPHRAEATLVFHRPRPARPANAQASAPPTSRRPAAWPRSRMSMI